MEPKKNCGRQRLKNLKWYGVSKHIVNSYYLWNFLYFQRNIIWNLDGLATIFLILRHLMAPLVPV